MKKFLILFSALLLFACGTTSSEEEDEEVISLEDAVVRFVFTTTEPNYDEVHVSYYDNKLDPPGPNAGVYPFSYDNSGNALPLEIVIEDYNFRYIDGEAYRNNHSEAQLSVQVYVNDRLILEDDDRGNSNRYATVFFRNIDLLDLD